MNAAWSGGMPTELFGSAGVITNVTSFLLYIVGAVSVIMVIVGGLRYAISGGNSSAVTAAKNTILYALVGLVVAVLAYAIVEFVLGAATGANAGNFSNV